jgi:hypothetical protein
LKLGFEESQIPFDGGSQRARVDRGVSGARGSRNWSPHESDDLAFLIKQHGEEYIISMSPRAAEHEPEYA